MSKSSKFLFSVGVAILLFTSAGLAQGITIKRSGVVLYGAAATVNPNDLVGI